MTSFCPRAMKLQGGYIPVPPSPPPPPERSLTSPRPLSKACFSWGNPRTRTAEVKPVTPHKKRGSQYSTTTKRANALIKNQLKRTVTRLKRDSFRVSRRNLSPVLAYVGVEVGKEAAPAVVNLPVSLGHTLDLVLLLDSVGVRRSASGVDDLIGEAFGDGLDVAERRFARSGGDQVQSLKKTRQNTWTG